MIFEIPGQLILSVENALACPIINGTLIKSIIGNMCAEHIGIGEMLSKDRCLADMLLTLFLANEKSRVEDSYWHAYFSIIPEATSIIMWTDEELEMMQDR